ncbi:MAG: hypothetical protein DIZ78_10930 [endosymbiont of Escarpia spicata]|uniref:Uncharacterized protein n=1 Tax=endosymbiont of Escarpia spicata TaxID=2200908 RepID=A0A370DKL6_9GAMM|nr:MAG: hypothetical protein DIZ78_10930 [endosymbiont of Escarpia spicata]
MFLIFSCLNFQLDRLLFVKSAYILGHFVIFQKPIGVMRVKLAGFSLEKAILNLGRGEQTANGLQKNTSFY